MKNLLLTIFILFQFLNQGVVFGQVPGYVSSTTFIEMRDGVKLYTEIYVPEGATEKLPILFTRTPYGVRTNGTSYGDYRLTGGYKELAKEKYIFVFQDIRGKYLSEGKFSLLRPIENGTKTNESTDAFDSMEWLVKNIPRNNGKIGMLGISYNSWLAAMALINPHPALATVSLQGTPSDLYKGDDFFHNGAFRLSPSFGYAVIMKENRGFPFPDNNAYQWFLNKGSLSNITQSLNSKNEYWNDFMNHLDYDSYWESRSLTKYLTATSVPTLNVAGWWDDQDFYGSLKIYEQLEKNDSLNLNYLVAGPWYHAGWEDPDDYYKKINLGAPGSTYYLNNIQAPWFRYYLKGEGKYNLPEATIFKTGQNRWEKYNTWPPKEVTQLVKWYLNEKSTLKLHQPGIKKQFNRYTSYPKNPVPYMAQPIPGFWEGGSLGWKADDQSFVTTRPDVLTWVSEPLTTNLDITGNIKVKLFASTSGTDCDWVVKLIDVYPPDYDPKVNNSKYDMDNFQMLIADEVIRAKYRNNLKKPEPVPANEIVEYEIDLLAKSHCFKKGHRLMVHIQSSWFPLIDINPQKFINISKAKPEDYQTAEQRIFYSKKFPSFIELPVMKTPPDNSD
jgi:putative CocE/NonD family hydrolase